MKPNLEFQLLLDRRESFLICPQVFGFIETMSLGDALKKAGLKSSEMKRKEAHGTKDKAKDGSKIHDHHHRTECEACHKTAPDVERYEHRNRLLDVQWLCLVCADQYKISDDFRRTAQSSFSKRKILIRTYGHTRKL